MCHRGTQDILVAVVDGLKGFPEAIESVFPEARVQTCIVHLIRYSLRFASWKQRKPRAAALKLIYRAETAEAALAPEIRRIIYTTNAIESLHSQVRKSVRSHGHFPSDQAATKLIWLVLRNIEAKWKRPPVPWAKARSQFAILFGDRFMITD